ncbi:MAG: hypothetical protein ACI9EQ_002111 [Bacteroidia bacterium]|jgi:hypothetical protein
MLKQVQGDVTYSAKFCVSVALWLKIYRVSHVTLIIKLGYPLGNNLRIILLFQLPNVSDLRTSFYAFTASNNQVIVFKNNTLLKPIKKDQHAEACRSFALQPTNYSIH